MSNPSEPVRIEVESVVDAIEESKVETSETVRPRTDEPLTDEPTTIVVEPVSDDEATC